MADVLSGGKPGRFRRSGGNARRQLDGPLALAHAEALLAPVPSRLTPDIDRLALALEARWARQRRPAPQRDGAARRPVT